MKIKSLITNLIISLGTGFLSALLTKDSMSVYENINKPLLSPAPIVFPIVWTVLFTLMGISSYLIYNSNSPNKSDALKIYGFQLIVNFIWPILFFNFKFYLISFVWLLLLWILILFMIISFYKISQSASYLQIPYILWVTFAGYLNLMIYMLNK